MHKVGLALFVLMQTKIAFASVYIQIDNINYKIQEPIPNLKDQTELRFRAIEKNGSRCTNQILLAITFTLTNSSQESNIKAKQEVRNTITDQINRYKNHYYKNLYLLVEEDISTKGKTSDIIAGNLANFALYKSSGKRLKDSNSLKNLRNLIQFSTLVDQTTCPTTHQSLDETTKHEADQAISHSEIK